MSAEAVRDMDDRQALFNAATVITRVARKAHRHPKTRAILLARAEDLRAAALALLAAAAGPNCWECHGRGFEIEYVTGRAVGRCRVCKGTGLLKAECPRLGRMACVRLDTHDPHALGGHQYAGDNVPDGHDASEAEAERTRS